MNVSSSPNVLLDSPPRRRATINWNVSWSLRRKKNLSADEPMTRSSATSKHKKFTLGPEEPDSDVDVDESSRYRALAPSPPPRTVYDLDPVHDQLPYTPSPLPPLPQAQPFHEQPALPLSRPQPRPQPMFHSQPIHRESDPLSLGLSHAHRRNSAPVSRRWTLAMAMTNTELDDEGFVKQVEAMRRASIYVDSETPPFTGSDDGEDFFHFNHTVESSYASDYEEEYALSVEDASSFYHTAPSTSDFHLRVPSAPNFPDLYAPLPFSPPTAENEWSSALHALLITRDLLRTERNYLASLLVLLDSSPCTSVAVTVPLHSQDSKRPKKCQLSWPRHPPPPLMHSYLLSLIATSHTLISKFESDPSVMGAARAFAENEEEVEKVFVGWCGVVGGWFIGPSEGGHNKRRRLSKTKFTEGKLTPSPSSTAIMESASPQRHTTRKSESGHSGFSTSSLRLAGSPTFSMTPLPPSPTSPNASVSTLHGNHQTPPRALRVHPARPLSILTPPSSPHHMQSFSKAKAREEKRPPLPRIPSARCEEPPPVPPKDTDVVYEQEIEIEKEKVTVSRSSSRVRLLNLVGVGKRRNDSEASLGSGFERSKSVKLKRSKFASSSPSISPDDKAERSKSASLFGGPRSRSHSAVSGVPEVSGDETSLGSGLKRSLSDYWRKSFPSGRRTVPPPPPPVPTLPLVDTSPLFSYGDLNNHSNGTNSATTSSGHDTDEGFYSADGCPVPRGPSTPASSAALGSPGSSTVSAGGGTVIGGKSNKRIYNVRDLAILPVQRVTRYALLYRDLLKHTPASSPCRPFLERAVEISHRIAQKCDKAQGNAQVLLTTTRPRRDRP
ncbi:hypothetical protein AAF712_004302 [Marasmius tenuissimus]|uniref:DH domain-containing protein n=1 Tax=Marasmius tenuissimus TaxID=585030 RepID=A0ABR3A5A7_9AGAR